MEKQSEDRRSRKSEQAIEDSFFELIKEYDISKISVTKICQRADINRSTFYAHYEDLNHFLDSLEYKMADILYDCTRQYHYDQDSGAFMEAIFQNMAENKTLFSYLFREESSGLSKKILMERLMAQTIPIWCRKSDVTKEQAKMIFIFIYEGMSAVLKYWVDSNYEQDISVIRELCENVAKHGAYNYIYTK